MFAYLLIFPRLVFESRASEREREREEERGLFGWRKSEVDRPELSDEILVHECETNFDESIISYKDLCGIVAKVYRKQFWNQFVSLQTNM